MVCIYGNIYHQYIPNVSIYTIHGSYGLWHIIPCDWVDHITSPLRCRKTTAIYFFSTRRSRRDTGVCPPCAPLTCRCKSSAVTKPRPQAHEKGYLQPRRHGIPRPSKYPSKWIKNVLYHAMVVLLQFLGGTWYMCLHLVKFLAITKSMIEHIAKMDENATSGNSLKTNKGKSQPFFSS